MSTSAVRDWSYASAMTNGKGGVLRQIWVRQVTDLIDPRVPLFLVTLSGSSKGLRHQVQVPPGVEVLQERELMGPARFGPKFPRIPRGMAICVYSDGTYRRYPPRDEKLFFRGADLMSTNDG